MYEVHKLDTQEQVFFYEQDHYYLSNFSSFGIEWEGHWFPTSEHAYHYARFGGNRTQEAAQRTRYRIKHSKSAHEAFEIAQEMKFRQRKDWDHIKVEFMKAILWVKVNTHPYIQKKLPQTGSRLLVEDSWRDDFWGWGPNKDGQNQLGKLWMEVRTELMDATNGK